MADMDIAVIQAAENLQRLQREQVKMQNDLGLGDVPNQISTPIVPNNERLDKMVRPGTSILNSILASVPHQMMGNGNSFNAGPPSSNALVD